MAIDPRLFDLLARHDDLQEQGQHVTPEELCRDCPELLPDVRRVLRGLRDLDGVLCVSTGTDGPTPTPPQDNVLHQPSADRPPCGSVGTDELPGAPAGRYQPLRLHARGGLGEVLVARDGELNRDVALKRMQPKWLGDVESHRRFLREAEITARLEHPGIVPVHGLVEGPDGQPCYAMRLIQGETLFDSLKQFHAADRSARDPSTRSLAFRQLLTRFVAVCNTLAYAHSRGVLHRDLKPQNIMLGPYGETLVVDWGLAKHLPQPEALACCAAETPRPPVADADEDSTVPGLAMGTPAYMSPEQAAGRWDEVGPGSDIWSLGATLYAILTGQPPYRDPYMYEKMERGAITPPRQVKRDVPATLEAICLKAMARRPADRYPTATALAEDVEHWLADEPVSAHREGWSTRLGRWGRRHRTAVTGVSVLLLTAVVGLGIGLVVVRGEQQQTLTALEAEGRRRQQARQALDLISSKVIDEWLGKQRELSPEHRDFLEKILASYEEFATDTGLDEAGRTGLANALMRVGGIHALLGQSKQAEAALQRSRDLYAQLSKDFPDHVEYRAQLAKSLLRLGIEFRGMGRAAEAETVWNDALTLCEALAVEFPTRTAFLLDLASTLNGLGALYATTDRQPAAEMAYRRALELYEQLAEHKRSDPDFRKTQAGSRRNLAITLEKLNKSAEAEQTYREAVCSLQGLIAEFPTHTEARQELARCFGNLGTLLRRKKSLVAAEAAYRESLALRKQLVADFPGRPQYRSDLALTCFNLANTCISLGQLQEAHTHFGEALQLRQQLVDAHPLRPRYRYDLAATYLDMGVLLEQAQRSEDAEKAYGEALHLFEQLATEPHAPPRTKHNLAITLANLACARELRQDPAGARHLWERAVAHAHQLVKANPSDPVARKFLTEMRPKLLRVLFQQGDVKGMAALAGQMLQEPGDAAQDAVTAAVAFVASAGHIRQNFMRPEAERFELAQNYCAQAVDALRQAVKHGFRDADRLRKPDFFLALGKREDFLKLLRELETREAAPRP